MRTGKRNKLHILMMAVILLLMACPVFAENEEPLVLTVEADPDCLLSEAGEMTFFRFTVKNTLAEAYELEDLTLRGGLLEEPKLIAESIVINANDVLEFTLENVRVEENEFDTDLSFQLTWRTTTFSEEDADHQNPFITDHTVSAPFRIERFIEPVMTLAFTPDILLAREGDTVTVTYTLSNETKFDMTNITLQDTALPQLAIPLSKSTLIAGEQVQATATFQMGTNTLELSPTAQYTVRGVESKVSAQESIIIEYVLVDLKLDVEKYPATSEGTLFRITLINEGTHPMTDIRLIDEIGSLIADGIALEAGAERTVSCTVPSAVSSGTVRYISFEASGIDCIGGVFTVKSPSAYEVLPFVESDQVRLNLSVTMAGSSQNDDGSNRLKLLFEIHNDSLVPISNAVITEGDYFKGVVNEFVSLSKGTTSFEKEFVVPAGTRSLTFVLTAMDPAQTQYASVPMTLDLSPLTAPKPTGLPAIRPGKTVDTTGTIYDTERYSKLFRMAALIALALTLMFLMLSLIFRVAEMNTRRWLPKESVIRPFGPRKTPTGSIPIQEGGDPIRAQFGYLQPAKLRYMDRTDRLPPVGQQEIGAETLSPIQPPVSTSTKSIPAVQSQPQTPSQSTREITAVPIRKVRVPPVMISSDKTMPFAPVHEGQSLDEAIAEETVKIQRESVEEIRSAVCPRVIETKAKPRIIPKQKLEIIHILQP